MSQQLELKLPRLCKHCRRHRPMLDKWGNPHVLCEPCAIQNVMYVNRAFGTLQNEQEMRQAWRDSVQRLRSAS